MNSWQKTILVCFWALLFLTPLVFYSYNFELFEYNKMTVTYLLTILITALWLIRMIHERRVIFQRTPLDIPIGLFLISQVLSTIFSIDPHTSVWGYYTRSNGGLLSTISYILLFYALVSNFYGQIKAIKSMLYIMLGTGLLVALWAILEHFGHSLSCLLITGQFNDGCWQQDVQARVFASLGQPNWLAAYLEMLIFPILYLGLTIQDKAKKFMFGALAIIYYLAFTFTYSRGATLGIICGMIVFICLLLFQLAPLPTFYSWLKTPRRQLISALTKFPKIILLILGLFIVVNLLFKSALTDFQLLHFDTAPNRPAILSSGSALDNGGTESGQIRLIVWQGAWQIFLHYPVLGSGVETFAYSYYNFRPLAHNMTSEWDFLYNKAHNEFLNYLSTTGIVGLGTYLFIIISFGLWCLKFTLLGVKSSTKKKSGDTTNLNLHPWLTSSDFKLFTLAILCSYISYHIQNFFQFSVVPIALFFFLFPGLVFSLASKDQLKFWKLQFPSFRFKLAFNPFSNKALRVCSIAIILAVGIILIYTLGKYWDADTLFAQGFREMENGSFGQAFYSLEDASNLNPGEPYYHSELGLAAAGSAVGLQAQDATTSAQLSETAKVQTAIALQASPANVSFWRTAFQTYYELSFLDPSYYNQALATLDEVQKLAPTDPQPLYERSLVLDQMHEPNEAIKVLKQALQMKPDYHDALLQLSSEYSELGQTDLAIKTLKTALHYTPNDQQTLTDLKKIQASSSSSGK